MNWLNSFRIKNKIIIIIIVIGALSNLAGSAINYQYEFHNTKERLIANSILHAKLISENCWLPLEFNYPKDAAEALGQLRALPEVTDGMLYTIGDTVFASYHKADNNSLYIPIELKTANYIIQGDYLITKQPVINKGEKYGTLYLRTYIDWYSLITARLFVSLGVIALMLLLVLFLAYMLQGTISQPIIELSQQMNFVANNKDYSIQLKNENNDEIGELYSEFNNMLAEINKKEQELQQSQANLSSLIESTDDFIWSVDRNFAVVTYNSALSDYIFQMYNSIIKTGVTIEPFHTIDHALLWQPLYKRCLDEGRYQIEYILLNSRILDLTFNPIIQNDKTIGIAVFGKDITDRKQAEEALKEKNEEYEALNEELKQNNDELYEAKSKIEESQVQFALAVKGSNDGIWDWNIVTNEIYFSPKWKEQIGYNDDEITNVFSSFENHLHPDDKKRVIEHLNNYLSTSLKKYDIEFRLRHKDNSYRWIQARGEALREKSGKPYRMSGSHTDITERKKTEEALQKYREHLEDLVTERTYELETAKNLAEAANKAKSVFLANMSHEIRTPMNAVLGFAQLLVRNESLSPVARNQVGSIMKSGDHLMGIINDVLEMSRIEAGRVELRNVSLDFKSLIDDLTTMFRFRAEEKNLIFYNEISPNIPKYIEADLGKLRQILINLLGNAVKFTPEGSVHLKIFMVNSHRIAIEVHDTGIGISLEEQATVFRSFERTQTGEKTAGGTGLGLSISKEYAQMMDGDISVTSETGKGSCFHFEFAVKKTDSVPVSLYSTQKVIGLTLGQEEKQVLVVDDIKENREVLRGMLEPLGFILTEAASGEEAIEMAATYKPHIILMDLVMTGIDGIETTRIIRKSSHGQSTVIIGISASAFEEDKKRFIEAGINVFIAKPFREQELFDALAQYADVLFETETQSTPTLIYNNKETIPTLEKMPPKWLKAFKQACTKGSINHIRQLGEEAKVLDSELSDYILKRVALYDLVGLKKIRE